MEVKNVRIIWEGLFFGKPGSPHALAFWHSDKPVYQHEIATRIAKLFSLIATTHKESAIAH
jgi:hypothetical protein